MAYEVSDPILCRDAKGKTRSWRYEVNGAEWRTVSGHLDGAPIETAWTTAKPKNVGKKNETTPEQQALNEARAEHKKKLDRDYRRTEAELDDVPPAPMLAEKWQDYQGDVSFPAYSQPKLDGIRALTSVRGSFSREFQPHHNIAHIVEAVRPIIAKVPSINLDGELYNHQFKDDFNSISSIVRKQKAGDAERAESLALMQYHIYDCFNPDKPDMPFSERDGWLERMFNQYLAGQDMIQRVPSHLCGSLSDLNLFYDRYLGDGYEGQMVRVDGVYEASKRSQLLLKRKEWETAEFELLTIEEGTGNWQGRAKRALVRLENGQVNGVGIKGNFAFTKKLLQQRDKYIGGPVTVRFAPQRTPDGQLRFPVAIDFHGKGGRKD